MTKEIEFNPDQVIARAILIYKSHGGKDGDFEMLPNEAQQDYCRLAERLIRDEVKAIPCKCDPPGSGEEHCTGNCTTPSQGVTKQEIVNIIHESELCKKGNANYQWSVRRQRKNDLADAILTLLASRGIKTGEGL